MKAVQLCGLAPYIYDEALVRDGVERWILGAGYERLQQWRWDRAFDVHPLTHILEHRAGAWAWYRQQSRPVYLLEAHPDVPTSLGYPREEVRRRLGPRGANALSSSIDQMMALALVEGYDTIYLDGVRLISVWEWVLQRECLAYWIGRAESMGVTVFTDHDSALCVPEVVYGFGEQTGVRRAPGTPIPIMGVPGQADMIYGDAAVAAMAVQHGAR